MTTTKVLLLGDIHGDAEFMLRAFRVARRMGCDRIFQVGDFGCYEDMQPGLDFLRRVEAGAAEYGIDLYFLDGNHDGMLPLWKKYGLTVQGSDFSDDGLTHVEGCSRGEFVKVRESVFYAPRGHRWEWGGVKFMSVGGAFSVNRAHMMPDIEWWPEEEITDEQVAMICDGPKVDVLLTHDIPAGFPLPAIAFKKEYPEAEPNREKVLEIVEAMQPQLLVHGHYHSRYGNWFTTPGGHRLRVEGLGANRTAEMDDPWMVIDLEAA